MVERKFGKNACQVSVLRSLYNANKIAPKTKTGRRKGRKNSLSLAFTDLSFLGDYQKSFTGERANELRIDAAGGS